MIYVIICPPSIFLAVDQDGLAHQAHWRRGRNLLDDGHHGDRINGDRQVLRWLGQASGHVLLVLRDSLSCLLCMVSAESYHELHAAE